MQLPHIGQRGVPTGLGLGARLWLGVEAAAFDPRCVPAGLWLWLGLVLELG
jgi:hypothetical protein